MDGFIDKLHYILAGALIAVSVVLLSLLLIAAGNIISGGSLQSKDTGQGSSTLTADILDDPNAVTASMAAMAKGFGQAMGSVGSTVGSIFSPVASAVAQGGKFVGNALYNSGAFAVNGVAKSAMFIIRIPSNILGFATNAPSVGTFIRPGQDMRVPTIKTYPASVLAAHTPGTVQHAAHTQPTWPMQGRVTTLFGVPHWPWQPTHTGIDISSGKPSGVTPIKPYQPGRVIKTIHSNHGLGNHVIVDHGSGVTSVYAHLHSISVKVGQEVGKKTTLGYEGSTGASTGAHLHFEIRLNGKPTDPKQHVHGHPH